MRASSIAWFAVGCGLAICAVASGRVIAESMHQELHAGSNLRASQQPLNPAPDAESRSTRPPVLAPDPSGTDVPVQRPRHLPETRSVAPPPPAPGQSSSWTPDEARLPGLEATAHWDPDEARMPGGPSVAMLRAFWNPDSATLPEPRRLEPATWNPDDARLPTLGSKGPLRKPLETSRPQPARTSG